MGPAPAAKGSGSGSGSAPPAPPGAVAMVELLHSVPATIRVSSRVANKAILPAHIADGDSTTAWNSRTGDLRGAWIDLSVPGAAIRDVRLIVGHTGRGPKGEDYFTMNPRIRAITLLDEDKEIARAELDIASRDLQVVKLPEPHAHVRVRIDDLVPGTRPAWREACVAEIEAWGTLPAGVSARKLQPTVEVALPPTEDWSNPPLDPDTYCTKYLEEPTRHYNESIAVDQAACNACMKKHPESDFPCIESGSCNPDPPGPPSCSIELGTRVTDRVWRGAGTMATSTDSVYSSIDTQIIVATPEGAWPIGDDYDCGHFSDTPRCEVSVVGAKVIAGGKLEVIAKYTQGDTTKDLAYVCDPTPVSCEPK